MLLFPDEVQFSYKPVKRRAGAEPRYRFEYTETFVKPPKGIMAATLTMMGPLMSLMGFQVSAVGQNQIRISGVASKKTISDMLVGEFLPQSNAGDLTLSTMMQSMAIGAATAAGMKKHGASKP